MKRNLTTALLWGALTAAPSLAQHAVQVVSYDAGATPAIDFGSGEPLDVPSGVLGSPERETGTGDFAGPVTVFNPPFLRDQIVSVGEGGHLTLRLSNVALPQAGVPEIGVFTNAGLIDVDFPNGQAGSPAGGFGGDPAVVSLSEDGAAWVELGSLTFDNPTNAYADVGATIPADYTQPFTGGLASFDGLTYSDAAGDDILGLLGGSGGGTWLDISGAGLSGVGYVRFDVPDDGDPSTGLNFELDGLSIAASAMGGLTVPEPASACLALAAGGVAMALGRRDRR